MDRTWRDARSIADLGAAMADWLEDPGVPADLDPETLPLVPVLARLNRRGFVTTMSQPGVFDTGSDGRPWDQRACVEGWIAAGDPLLPRIVRAARAAGLIVTAYGAGRAVGPRKGLLVSRWDDEPRTGCGGRHGRSYRRADWRGFGRQARRQLAREGAALAIIDPVWGRDTVLWPLLEEVCDEGAPL